MPVVDAAYDDELLKNIVQYFSINTVDMEKEIHLYAANLLNEGKVDEAWQVLLAAETT
jgi:hypothetical protein